MFSSFFLLGALCLLCVLGAVKATIGVTATIEETLDATILPFGQTGGTTVKTNGLNFQKTLEATSAAGTNVTKVGYGTLTMIAGVATLNLAAIPGVAGIAQDFTGLKLRSIVVRAKSTNVDPVTFKKGAANGYTGLGANFEVDIEPGKTQFFEPNADAVAAGVRTLDIAGTGTEALEYVITAGNN